MLASARHLAHICVYLCVLVRVRLVMCQIRMHVTYAALSCVLRASFVWIFLLPPYN
jgi:hypothetical protein